MDGTNNMGENTPSIERQAATWYVKLTSEDWDGADQQALNRWLKVSSDHVDAMNEVYRVLGVTDEAFVDPNTCEGIFANTYEKTRVLSFSPAIGNSLNNRWNKMVISLSSAVAIALLASLVFLFYVRNDSPVLQILATQEGEIETFTLPDGSLITLNTSTSLHYTFNDRKREIVVETGEAIFDVAHNPDIPFVVMFGSQEVSVLGTVFAVSYLDNISKIEVSDGKVTVRDLRFEQKNKINELLLIKGMVAEYEYNRLKTLEEKKSESSFASWQRGMLVYSSQPLSHVIKDIDRYYPGDYVLTDHDGYSASVSLVLHITEENEMLRRIGKQFDLKFHKSGDTTFFSVDK